MVEKINFIKMNEDEMRLVLSWRNDERIKKWMHSRETISLQSHLAFIESLKNNSKKDYFLIKKSGEYIGVVNLNDGFLGIYANPDKRRVGDILLKEIINFAFKVKRLSTLKAEVYKKNLSAIKLYERFNFKTINNKDNILTMELINENR